MFCCHLGEPGFITTRLLACECAPTRVPRFICVHYTLMSQIEQALKNGSPPPRVPRPPLPPSTLIKVVNNTY